MICQGSFKCTGICQSEAKFRIINGDEISVLCGDCFPDEIFDLVTSNETTTFSECTSMDSLRTYRL